jgi:hypothetical protein
MLGDTGGHTYTFHIWQDAWAPVRGAGLCSDGAVSRYVHGGRQNRTQIPGKASESPCRPRAPAVLWRRDVTRLRSRTGAQEIPRKVKCVGVTQFLRNSATGASRRAGSPLRRAASSSLCSEIVPMLSISPACLSLLYCVPSAPSIGSTIR